MLEKTRENGFSGSPPAGPKYSTLRGSVQKIDFSRENEFLKKLLFEE
jgi:hypothetical protein